MIYDRETWWKDKTQKGRALIEEIKVLAERARASGYPTAEYVLNLAAAEISKDIDEGSDVSKSQSQPPKCG
jgi:hypothetical protein